MPDDNRTQDQSNGTPLNPPDDLTAPEFGCDITADSRMSTAPVAEARNEMPPSSASKAPTRWGRVWLGQILFACLLLISLDLLGDADAAEFARSKEESQEARKQEEYNRIVNEYDDPLMRTIAIAEHCLKQLDAPEARRAFADREWLERLKRVEQQSRRLESIAPDNVFIREPVGAVLNVAPELLSIFAWLTGSGETADELRRQSHEFQLARRELWLVAHCKFIDDESKPTGSPTPTAPENSEAQPQTEPSATTQVEDAPPRTPEELFEERVLSSPLVKRAMMRSRTEELIERGLKPEKAAEQARREHEGREATPGSSVAQPRTEPSETTQVEDAPPRTPEQIDFEEFVLSIDFEGFVLSSPSKQRALTRVRTEELIAAGVDPTKAAEQARQEQAERVATQGSTTAQPRTAPNAIPQVEDAPPRTPEELFARASSSVVRINVRDAKSESIGVGSGFFVRDDSTIVTNFHVIEGAHSAEVVLQDGTQFVVSEAETFDEKSDVAILHVVHDKTKRIRPLALAFEVPPVASKAYVIGAPAGLENSFSEGSVSGHREMSDRKWIQTTAPISPGSSGSPVFNDRGLVIGMATMSRVVGQNLNFAIASRHIREVLHDGRKQLPIKLTELSSRMQPSKPAIVDLPPGADRDIFQIIAGEALKASYLSGDEKKRAMRDILRRLESLPDEEKKKVGYWTTLSSIHFLSDRPQLQMDAAETAVRIHAKDKRAWVELDFALQWSLPRDWRRLLEVRQQIIQLEEYEPKAEDFASLGEAFRELGRYDEAVAAYYDALVRDPEHSDSYLGLGQTYQLQKQYVDAVKMYKDAIEFASLDIVSVRSYLGLAECYKEMGEFQEAIQAYKKALELADEAKKPWHFVGLGDAFQELGRYDEAVAAYDNALVSDPEYSDGYYGLGQVHQKRKKYIAAVTNYKKAIKFASHEFQLFRCYLRLSECYEQMSDFREAIRAAEKVLELMPDGLDIETNIREFIARQRRRASE
jgi:S1-C subfamily serine protease/tetratricopeptide (TPR) repeat protein